jgi:hypothetical protein
MDPTAAPTERSATVAQITVPTGSAWEATVNVQGRSPEEFRVWNVETGHMEGDWQEEGFVFASDFADIPPESVFFDDEYANLCNIFTLGTCNVDVDECASTPCGNGASCSESAIYSTIGREYTHAVPEVVAVATDGVDGFTTYRLNINLQDSAVNVYAMFGHEGKALVMPPAFQVAAPFGANFGGVSPALFAAMPNAEYDSWLTLGLTEGDPSAKLGVIGLDFDSWGVDSQLTTLDGSLFYMDPTTAPSDRSVCIGQLTTLTGLPWSATVNLQGRAPEDQRVYNFETGQIEGGKACLTENSLLTSDISDVSEVLLSSCCLIAGRLARGRLCLRQRHGGCRRRSVPGPAGRLHLHVPRGLHGRLVRLCVPLRVPGRVHRHGQRVLGGQGVHPRHPGGDHVLHGRHRWPDDVPPLGHADFLRHQHLLHLRAGLRADARSGGVPGTSLK